MSVHAISCRRRIVSAVLLTLHQTLLQKQGDPDAFEHVVKCVMSAAKKATRVAEETEERDVVKAHNDIIWWACADHAMRVLGRVRDNLDPTNDKRVLEALQDVMDMFKEPADV